MAEMTSTKDDGNVDILGVFHGSLEIARYQL